MKSLTSEQTAALFEVRRMLLQRLCSCSFTPEMLQDKSLRQLMILHYLMLGHTNCPGHWQIMQVLDELFGVEALTARPESLCGTEGTGLVH